MGELKSTSPVRGTVSLIRQLILLIAYLIFAGIVALFLFDYSIGLIIIGVGLFAIGGIAIAFRRIIWDSYYAEFKKTKRTGIFKKLSEPSMLAYRLNVILVLPLVVVLGISLVIIGIFSSLN